jgi:hypothetical protein
VDPSEAHIQVIPDNKGVERQIGLMASIRQIEQYVSAGAPVPPEVVAAATSPMAGCWPIWPPTPLR